MNSPKNLALVVLAVAAIGGAVLVFKQQMELQSLRASALANSDRDELNRRALAAERRAKELADELSALRKKGSEPKAGVARGESSKPGEEKAGMPNVRTLMSNAANMMNRPEVQRMMAMGQKAALDTNYAKLFKQLNLSPDNLEQFKKLMVERQTVGTDVFSAAVQQGLDPMQDRAEIRKLTADAQNKVDSEIKSLLGDTDYASYQNYQHTLPQRSVVNQLQQSLSYTPSPLSDTQAEQLVQVLAANPVARPARAAGGAPDGGQNVTTSRTMVFTASGGGDSNTNFVAPVVASGGMMGLGGAPISDAAVDASRAVLTDPQVQALQQMQQQQSQMRSMMQSAGTDGAHGGVGIIRVDSTVTTSPAATPPPSPAGSGKPPGGE